MSFPPKTLPQFSITPTPKIVPGQCRTGLTLLNPISNTVFPPIGPSPSVMVSKQPSSFVLCKNISWSVEGKEAPRKVIARYIKLTSGVNTPPSLTILAPYGALDQPPITTVLLQLFSRIFFLSFNDPKLSGIIWTIMLSSNAGTSSSKNASCAIDGTATITSLQPATHSFTFVVILFIIALPERLNPYLLFWFPVSNIPVRSIFFSVVSANSGKSQIFTLFPPKTQSAAIAFAAAPPPKTAIGAPFIFFSLLISLPPF